VLDLYFETPDRHVDARGGHRYVLYRDGLGYPLPDVVLATQEGTATVALREVAITEITPADDADLRPNSNTTLLLRDKIKDAWAPLDPAGPGYVPVRHVVTRDRSVPADVVEAAGAANGNSQAVVSMDVTWRWLYTDTRGLPAHGSGKARLEFAPAGRTPPARSSTLDPVAERLGVPAPVRNVGNRPSYRYFAAVDFGTSTSTVTLYDVRNWSAYRMDPGQAKVLSAALTRLLKSTAPAQLQARWEKTVAELLTRVGRDYPTLSGASLDVLCRRLDSTQSSSGRAADRLLEIVCVWLDRLAAEEQAAPDKALATWLGPQVLDCYDEAFNRPPLTTLNLQPVDLDPPHRYEVPTELAISGKAPVAIEFGTGGVDAIRNLKSKLGDPEPLGEGIRGEDGADANTDNLIALVYKDLIERTEKFARGDDLDAPDEAVTDLVATFPTITPAGARQHLTTLLEYTLDLKQVTVEYDEGVAAALYFLMRDFGGTRAEFGAEALRARSEYVPSDPPKWQQNMLVIDIGAGTTDIALLRLTLLENNRPIAGADPNVQGKYYIVQPEVVNSTGHAQLGGNYLTLRVFYWLKAAIVDAMLTGPGEDAKRAELAKQVRHELELGPQDEIPGLAELVAQAGEVESPVPQQVAAALNSVLPTRWGPKADSTAKDAFWSLWNIAESAKIALGAGPLDDGDEHVSRDSIVSVLTNIDVKMSKERETLIPPSGVRLGRASFRALARPVIAHAAELAWWLVQQSLGKDKPERLDRVMLSGKTSMMELTQRVITEELGSASGGSRVGWNPTAIAVERTYAKQAASIGAAWAAEISARITDLGGERDQLANGRSVLKINVDSVYSSLPCEFVQVRAGETTVPLLAAGTPLVEIDKEGNLAARQEWTEQEQWPALMRSFEVHRPVQPGKTQVWGTYRFEHDAKNERGFTLDRSIWLTSSMGDAGARIRAQVQIDPRLNPTLNICHGRPHYLISLGGPVATRDLRGEFPDDAWDQIEQRLRALPGSIVIVGAKDKRHPEGEQEFPVWQAQPDELVSAYFPDFFHEHAGLDSETVPGRIAFDLPLPSLVDGTYRLLLRDPATGKDRDLDVIRVPAYGERTVRYTATLDLRGRFALHRGCPPYWMAGTLREVERHPGAVLFRTMEPGKTNRNPRWDPFTGKH
jgi:hypothetical protein